MNFRILISILFLYNLLYANIPKVSIGTIDRYYKDKISVKQLKIIVNQIEREFESALNANLFDYDENGIRINLIYTPYSKLEKQILNKKEKLDSLEKKIDNQKTDILLSKKKNLILRDSFSKQNKILNNKIASLNRFIKKINGQKNISNKEFVDAKTYVSIEQKKINKEIQRVKLEHRKVSQIINSFNKKLIKYNNLIRTYNINTRELESLTRGFKKIKGKTFKLITKQKTKNGTKVLKNYMTKIEIYGFDNIQELKAVIAHEIGHLLGVSHINIKNALMNPIIQSKQLERLHLTYDDIKVFREILNKKEKYEIK